MIPTVEREGLLDRCRFSHRKGRDAAARGLPIGDLRRLAEDRQELRAELERLLDRDG